MKKDDAISTSGKAAASEREIEIERSQFRALIAANPNYFGNLEESEFPVVQKISGNTSYEELHCLGFDHEHDLLEATLHIKRPFGYRGDLCHDGSTEYVRFYLDYGSGWVDAGIASVNVHDIPNSADCAGDPTKPLVYVVTQRLDPRRKCCRTPVLPRARAILSWETPPPAGAPNWPPVWGNVLDRHIQIKQRDWTIGCLFDSFVDDLQVKPKIPDFFKELQEIPIPIPDPGPELLPELVKRYAQRTDVEKPPRPGKAAVDTAVEPHRFGLPLLKAALDTGGLDGPGVAAMARQFAALGLDWAGTLKALEQTKANTSYEELNCLGLDYNREWLVATLQIKRPTGYSGTLCHHGSHEHVAFWADWEDKCEWTYLGTVSVNVHDFIPLPNGGLHYAAILPVDLSKYRLPCSRPRISRVRAVLSWSTLPSTTDPDDLQTYGNRLDAHVQVRPGPVITSPIPHIRSLGGIPIEHIDTTGDGMTRMLGAIPAKFWFNDAAADPWGLNRDCPFGGNVLVHGMWFPGYKYRILVKKETEASSAAKPLLDSFNVTKWTPGFDVQSPNSLNPLDPGYGFFDYLNPVLYLENNMLGTWSTSTNEKWKVRLQLANAAHVVLGSTPWLKLQLNNEQPDTDIHIDNGGDCKGFNVGDVIQGTFVARHAYFGAFSLDVLPDNVTIPSNEPATAWPSTSQTPVAGAAWTLNTGAPITMNPCGYVARVVAVSRTIVGSQSSGHFQSSQDTGFYLLA